MPPQRKVQAETNIVVDRDANKIMLTRTFAAPREQIFEAWTRPEHVACWWDPAGFRLVECEIDLRPGGAFRFVSQGSTYPFSGFYREIAPPARLIFEAMGSLGKVALNVVSGKTVMTVTIECGSSAQLDQFVKMGVDVGTSQTLDNLVAYVGTMLQ
jgi:uncharacterized protein YndB with AHSA1/START domain